MFIVILGSAVSGFTFHGPFGTKKEADNWAWGYGCDPYTWTVAPLAVPAEPEEVDLDEIYRELTE